jgi:hypothetical protein
MRFDHTKFRVATLEVAMRNEHRDEAGFRERRGHIERWLLIALPRGEKGRRAMRVSSGVCGLRVLADFVDVLRQRNGR